MTPNEAPGCVIVYTGHGKGKTTAALGAAIRAAGQDLKICVIFFMKGPGYKRGEVNTLAGIEGIELHSFGSESWVDRQSIKPQDVLEAHNAFECALGAVLSNNFDLVILDEVISAVNWGLLKFEQIENMIQNKPSHISMILTGRNADQRLFDLAHIVTEMKMIKHQYDSGIPALKGLDY